MALIVRTGNAREKWWVEQLQGLLPEIPCRPWSDPGDPDDIEIAVVWKPPPGELKRYTNLRLIVSIGAGVDHVLTDPELPKDVPIIRTTGGDLKIRMREYVCLQVLRLHRRLPEIEAAQAERRWLQLIEPPAQERRVGILGLGDLGGDCARTLAMIGFDVRGWSRGTKSIEGVASFAGEDALGTFLEDTEILVCLLPLTKATSGILNRELFDRLPKGASIVNAARGEHLVEDDLLDALDRGQIGAAALDVFTREPLPAASPFWGHPNVLVTPHVASLIDPAAGGRTIAANIRKFLDGEPIRDMVNRERGY